MVDKEISFCRCINRKSICDCWTWSTLICSWNVFHFSEKTFQNILEPRCRDLLPLSHKSISEVQHWLPEGFGLRSELCTGQSGSSQLNWKSHFFIGYEHKGVVMVKQERAERSWKLAVVQNITTCRSGKIHWNWGVRIMKNRLKKHTFGQRENPKCVVIRAAMNNWLISIYVDNWLPKMSSYSFSNVMICSFFFFLYNSTLNSLGFGPLIRTEQDITFCCRIIITGIISIIWLLIFTIFCILVIF